MNGPLEHDGPPAGDGPRASFRPPPFDPDPWIRGGHLQTIAAAGRPVAPLAADRRHVVALSDGDAIVLHENAAVDGRPESPAAVLVHGLSGCHGSPYMVRLAKRLVASRWRVFRVDMRGCGEAYRLSRQLSHAGRSEDVAAALGFVAGRYPTAAIAAVGISLGGNQLLRMVGRVGAGLDERPDWFDSLCRVAVVAPPIDLLRCSENMQRLSRRIYNRYFIRNLLRRIPPLVRSRVEYERIAAAPAPRTLFELDDRITAPLSGFSGAADYYRHSGAHSVTASNPVKTLVLAARDDPIVPVDCFQRASWPESTEVCLTRTGGHMGFVGRGRQPWMAECLHGWINRF